MKENMSFQDERSPWHQGNFSILRTPASKLIFLKKVGDYLLMQGITHLTMYK